MAAFDRAAVMFATLTGIDALAALAGQRAAHDRRQACLDRLLPLVDANDGELVEVIGDDILAVFPTPEAALGAACRMQSTIAEAPDDRQAGLSLQIGIHWGMVYRRDADIFGDAVNTASRVRDQAAPGLIVTSRETREAMHDQTTTLLQPFDRVRVKGKAEELVLYQAAWQPEDLNRTAVVASMIRTGRLKDLAAERLTLVVDGRRHELTPTMMPLVIGRGRHCELPVDSPAASRNHCRVNHRRGKFVLVDESTNGTHLMRADGSEVVLRREETVLTGRGRFALGVRVGEDPRWVIEFETT